MLIHMSFLLNRGPAYLLSPSGLSLFFARLLPERGQWLALGYAYFLWVEIPEYKSSNCAVSWIDVEPSPED
jgi:hypothetical protein